MWTFLTVVVVLLSGVLARPEQPAAANQPPVEVVSQSEVVNGDGTFNYSYELSNGIRVQESGYVKQNPNALTRSGAEGADDENSGDINVAQGSFSYTAPDGTLISLSYTADENGFQPQGAHLPTPPPVPEAIARALSAAPPAPEDPQP